MPTAWGPAPLWRCCGRVSRPSRSALLCSVAAGLQTEPLCSALFCCGRVSRPRRSALLCCGRVSRPRRSALLRPCLQTEPLCSAPLRPCLQTAPLCSALLRPVSRPRRSALLCSVAAGLQTEPLCSALFCCGRVSRPRRSALLCCGRVSRPRRSALLRPCLQTEPLCSAELRSRLGPSAEGDPFQRASVGAGGMSASVQDSLYREAVGMSRPYTVLCVGWFDAHGVGKRASRSAPLRPRLQTEPRRSAPLRPCLRRRRFGGPTGRGIPPGDHHSMAESTTSDDAASPKVQ